MSLRVTLEVVDAYGASEAIKMLGRMYPEVAPRAHTGDQEEIVRRVFAGESFSDVRADIAARGELARNQPGQICTDPNPAETFEQTHIVDLDTDATGNAIFNEAELAADAVPPPPMFPPAVDPATLGFGAAPPVPTAVPPPPAPPVPAPLVSVSTAPNLPPPAQTGLSTVPLDTAGLPHDARIHASTKTKIANGEWKRKPRVTDEDYARVVAELRSIMAVPAPAVAAAVPPPPPVPGGPTPPPIQPVGGMPSSFPEFMMWAVKLIEGKRLAEWQVAETAAKLGLVDGEGKGSIRLLQQRPDLIMHACEDIRHKVAPDA